MKKRYNIKFHVEKSQSTDGQGNYVLTGSDIELGDAGLYITQTNGWSLKPEHLTGLDVVKIDSSKLDNKSIYRYPKLSLPRQKVDLLKERFNLKVVRNKDKADYHVVSMKLLSTMFTFPWGAHYSYKELWQTFKGWKDKNLLSTSGLEKCRQILEGVDQNALFVFNNNGYHRYFSETKLEKFYDAVRDTYKDIEPPNSRAIVIESTNIQAYKDIFSSNNIIYDAQLLDIIDEDLAVIDNSQYEQVESMITSSDRDNRNLAVEMIANCNINKSFDVASGLYWWHYHSFKDTDHWNSVNVKAMREQLKGYEGGHEKGNIYSYNSYIQTLAEDGKLTKFVVDKTRKYLLDNFLSSYVGKQSQVFTVDLKDLKITDKFKNQIVDE